MNRGTVLILPLLYALSDVSSVACTRFSNLSSETKLMYVGVMRFFSMIVLISLFNNNNKGFTDNAVLNQTQDWKPVALMVFKAVCSTLAEFLTFIFLKRKVSPVLIYGSIATAPILTLVLLALDGAKQITQRQCLGVLFSIFSFYFLVF